MWFRLRFFNVYGYNQDNRMVVPRFFEQAVANEPLTVFGSGKQTRDFTYIDDTVEACIRLMDAKGSHIVNIANEAEWCIDDLAGLKSKKLPVPNRLSNSSKRLKNVTIMKWNAAWVVQINCTGNDRLQTGHHAGWKD